LEIKTLTYCDKELWEEVAMYAGNCSWDVTGKYLSSLMKNNGFSDWERVFVALENHFIAGFCTLSKTSSVLNDIYTPYVGFIFVGEPYRGNRVSEKLCFFAINYAKTVGFDKVYLYSELVNFYEKYGFIKIDEKEAPWGEKLSIYMHYT
jgi:N-acetylglutamate synthase-like GNAT family acetyltransferase